MAKNGTIGLESAFGVLLTVLPLETATCFFLNPGKRLFGIENDSLLKVLKPISPFYSGRKINFYERKYYSFKIQNFAF